MKKLVLMFLFSSLAYADIEYRKLGENHVVKVEVLYNKDGSKASEEVLEEYGQERIDREKTSVEQAKVNVQEPKFVDDLVAKHDADLAELVTVQTKMDGAIDVTP